MGINNVLLSDFCSVHFAYALEYGISTSPTFRMEFKYLPYNFEFRSFFDVNKDCVFVSGKFNKNQEIFHFPWENASARKFECYTRTLNRHRHCVCLWNCWDWLVLLFVYSLKHLPSTELSHEYHWTQSGKLCVGVSKFLVAEKVKRVTQMNQPIS